MQDLHVLTLLFKNLSEHILSQVFTQFFLKMTDFGKQELETPLHGEQFDSRRFLKPSHSQQQNHWAERLDETRLDSNDGNSLMETPSENKREIKGEKHSPSRPQGGDDRNFTSCL